MVPRNKPDLTLSTPQQADAARSIPAKGFERAMDMPEFPTVVAGRQKLEEWRLKLQEAKERYHAATALYRKILQERPEGRAPSPNDSLARARQAESQSLAEYTRVLRIFTELTVHGKAPEEQSAASGNDK